MVDLDSMTEAVATYAARTAEKMRRHGVRAVHLCVFMHTSRFSEGPGYSNGATAQFLEATNDTGEMVALAVRLARRIWRDGFRYANAGVITELLPATARQPALWSEIDRDKREKLWKVVDGLNGNLGRGAVRILSEGPKAAAWKLRAEHRSPRWTTRWEELPRVRAR